MPRGQHSLEAAVQNKVQQYLHLGGRAGDSDKDKDDDMNNNDVKDKKRKQEAGGQSVILMMRSLVSSIVLHPQVLVHKDFLSLRDFFLAIGVEFGCDSTDISIPLEPSENPRIAPRIRPPLPEGYVPSLMSFGHIKNMIVEPEKNTVTITEFSLTEQMKAVIDIVLCRIYDSPAILYTSKYLFLYEFFIHLGASVDKLDQLVTYGAKDTSQQHECLPEREKGCQVVGRKSEKKKKEYQVIAKKSQKIRKNKKHAIER